MRALGRWLLPAGLATAFLLSGCGKKPTREDCDKMIEHSIELTAKGQEEQIVKAVRAEFTSMKEILIQECLRKTTAKHVACALAAADLPALEACQSVN